MMKPRHWKKVLNLLKLNKSESEIQLGELWKADLQKHGEVPLSQ